MTITSANVILYLQVESVFPTAQRIQCFAPEDAFDTEALEVGEDQMGVDGCYTAGFVFTPTPLTVTLLGDSESVAFFDTWWLAERQAKDKLRADGTITFPSLRTKYALTKGFLRTWSPFSDAKKVLQPRKATMRWQSALPAPMTGSGG